MIEAWIPAPADALTALAGYYQRAESDVPLHVVAREDDLALLSSGLAQSLRPIGPRRFRVERSASVVTFEPVTGDGDVELRLSGPTRGLYTRSAPARTPARPPNARILMGGRAGVWAGAD